MYNLNSNTTAWPQGRVAVNCLRDDDAISRRLEYSRSPNKGSLYALWKNAPLDGDDIFTINPGDVVLRPRSDHVRSAMRDTDFVVTSSLNGLFTSLGDYSRSDLEAIRVKARNELVLVGLADTASAYDLRDSTRNTPSFVTMIGGVKTTVNTGTKSIMQGDIVVWDLPELSDNIPVRKNIRGVPDEKILPVLRPIDNTSLDDRDVVASHLKLNSSDLTDASGNYSGVDMSRVDGDHSAQLAADLSRYSAMAFALGVVFARNNNTLTSQEIVDSLGLGSSQTSDVMAADTSSIPILNSLPSTGFDPARSLMRAMLGLSPVVDVKDATIDEDVLQNAGVDLLNSLKNAYLDLNGRIVGTALTPAQPGQELDIRIGAYCI